MQIIPEDTPETVLHPREDRRLLPHVPSARRLVLDRRDQAEEKQKLSNHARNPALVEHDGLRYMARYKVRVRCRVRRRWHSFKAESEDISTTGISVKLTLPEQRKLVDSAQAMKLVFRIRSGTMPEGYEGKMRIKAKRVRMQPLKEGGYQCGLRFDRSLIQRVYNRKGRQLRAIALVSLVLLVAMVVIMRAVSFQYFSFNRLLYVYSVVTGTYLVSRYLFGAMYKPVPVDPAYTPKVSIVIPCFNEEEWIARTLLSCLDQEYPPDDLEVILVDDCSTDASAERVEAVLKELYQQRGQDVYGRVRFVRQPRNLGKREAMARGAKMANHDLLVFVDSDSFLEPNAIINLVQPFKDPRTGGVSGRTDVANTYTNFMTKMQSVRYFVAFRILKAAEAYFDSVTCLSGPLSCYRKEIVLEHSKAWLSQKFLGVRATFGDDRSMTNFVLRKHRTYYQDTAVCSTIVPSTHKQFLRQQMRWKRSWLRESCIAATFMWRKEPLMALSFYFGFLIPILSPVVVIYNLVYIPIAFGFFPRTFLLGLLIMSLLMSSTQLLMRRSSIWYFGIVFCAYYLLVLMWQMPIAWVTFWKSTWGTRMTPKDVAQQTRHNGYSVSG